MKKILFLCLTGLLVAFAGINQAQAGIYVNTVSPVNATSMQVEDIRNLKCGESQSLDILGFITTGDAGIQTAAKRAGITQIHHVDQRFKGLLFVTIITTQVYGE